MDKICEIREEEHNRMKFDESDQIKDEMDLFLPILILSSPGIDAGEVNKQQDARICASDGWMMHNKKSVTRIKELSQGSFRKMFEAAEKLMNFGSITDSEAELKRQAVIIPIFTTGSQALDELLNGEDGIKSLAITELPYNLNLRLAKELVEEPFRLLMADSTTRLLEVNMSGREELKECQQQLAAKLSHLIKTDREFKLAIYMASPDIADLGGGVLESGTKPAGGHMLAPRTTITLTSREGKGEQPICRDADASNLTELLMASSAEATSKAPWIRLVIGRTALIKREAFSLINARSEETCVGSVDAVELLKADLLNALVRATREPAATSSNWIVDAAHLLKLFPLLTRTRAGSSHDPPSNLSKLSLHMLHVISHASTSDSSPVASTSNSNRGKTSRRSSLREPPTARLELVSGTKPEPGLNKFSKRWKPNMSKAKGRLSCVLLGKSEIAEAFSVLDPVTKKLWQKQYHEESKFDQLDYSTDGWLLMRKSRDAFCFHRYGKINNINLPDLPHSPDDCKVLGAFEGNPSDLAMCRTVLIRGKSGEEKITIFLLKEDGKEWIAANLEQQIDAAKIQTIQLMGMKLFAVDVTSKMVRIIEIVKNNETAELEMICKNSRDLMTELGEEVAGYCFSLARENPDEMYLMGIPNPFGATAIKCRKIILPEDGQVILMGAENLATKAFYLTNDFGGEVFQARHEKEASVVFWGGPLPASPNLTRECSIMSISDPRQLDRFSICDKPLGLPLNPRCPCQFSWMRLGN